MIGRLPRSRSPPGAEDADEAAVPELSCCLEDDVERLGGVCVVDDECERLPLVDGFESTGHAGDGANALRYLVVVDVEEQRGSDDAEDVLDVEPTPERRLDLDAGRAKAAAVRAHLQIIGAHLGAFREAERDHGRPRRLDELDREPAPVLVADVDGGGRRSSSGEESSFRLVVLLHRPVQVEVILREVREDEHVEAHAIESPQGGPVGRGLDGHARVARIEHLAEETLKIDRLGRRVWRGPMGSADDPLDRADEARRATGRLEDGAEQKRTGRLAVRARDACDLERARRLVEEVVGGDRHRRASVVDEQLRNVDLERLLHDESRGPGGHCSARELVSVDARAGHAEERRPRRDAIGAVGEIRDLDGLAALGMARREHARQFVEVHGVTF